MIVLRIDFYDKLSKNSVNQAASTKISFPNQTPDEILNSY